MSEPLIAAITSMEATLLHTYPKGQTILYPGDESPYIYLMVEGAVTMHDVDERGMRKLLHIFGPPSLFPMVSFGAHMAEACWFYTTLTDTKVYLVPYDKLKSHIESSEGSQLSNILLRQLLGEVHELLVRINSATRTDSSIRLIAALQFLGHAHTAPRKGDWRPVKFPVSHQLLAELTGLSRETISIKMKQLTLDKVVRYPKVGRLELHTSHLKRVKL